MKPPVNAAIYTQYRKARHFTEAMVAGFPAREHPSEPGRLDPAAGLHILGGLQFGSLELMRQIWPEFRQYVFWDRAYFGGGSQSDRLRITHNAYQKHRIEPDRSLARFETLGGSIRPWRKSGSHILVVPPSEAILAIFSELPGRQAEWLRYTLKALKSTTDRPVLVSYKGDARPLADRLRDCHAVVTYTSNVAVEAICAGVPAYCAHFAAAGQVAGGLHLLHHPGGLDAPPMPEREAWAASLAWGQFSTAEIRSGFAWSVVMGNA